MGFRQPLKFPIFLYNTYSFSLTKKAFLRACSDLEQQTGMLVASNLFCWPRRSSIEAFKYLKQRARLNQLLDKESGSTFKNHLLKLPNRHTCPQTFCLQSLPTYRVIHITFLFQFSLAPKYWNTSRPFKVKPLYPEFELLQSSPVIWGLHLHLHSKEVSVLYSGLLPLWIRSYLLCSQYPSKGETQCTILLTPVSDN